MRPTRLIGMVLSAVVLLVGLILFLRQQPATDDPTDDPQVLAAAAADYVKYCAACHGLDGRTVEGSIAPNLASDDVLALATDAFLRAAIARGRPGRDGLGAKGVKMQGYARSESGPLDDAAVDGLVRHLRTWQKAESVDLDEAYAASGDVAVGATVYARACAACHGEAGWSDQAPRLAGSVFQASAADDFIRQTIRRGRAGTTMRPIALAPAEEDALIAFIRTFSPTPPE